MDKGKVILLDCSVFVHRAIFSWGAMIKAKASGKFFGSFIPPVGYTYFSMIIGCLKKLGVDSGDIIIMAQDGRDSWRKDVYADYKAQRKEFRESHKEINWEKSYAEIARINDQIKKATNFHFIQINKIEADDVIAVSTDFYKDRPCIVVSIDKDLEQLTHRSNVRIFSLMANYKGTKGSYKVVKNPLKIIKDKALKGDISDNILVDKENDTDEDYNLREYIINLIRLPDFVTKPVMEKLMELPDKDIKEFIFSELPFPKSLANKFEQIFEKDAVIDYEDVVGYLDKKKERVKKKKAKAKAAAKETQEPKVSLR